jgi:hypothetical protein
MRKLYYNNRGLRLKEIFYLILINISSIIVCYFIIHDSILFLLEFLKNIVILELLLDTGINTYMADNLTSNSTDVGSSSSTTGTETGNDIPITRQENDTIKSYLGDLNWSVENYLYTTRLRDHYRREGLHPLVNHLNIHLHDSKIRIENQLNRVLDYKLHLLNNKYERSDKVNEHMESLDTYTEDKAISILDE